MSMTGKRHLCRVFNRLNIHFHLPIVVHKHIAEFQSKQYAGCLSHEPTILIKTFGTLCVLGDENVIQVDPPPPLNSVGCYKSNTFYISCTLYGPQLCLGVGEWGENPVKAMLMSVYRRLAAISIQNQVKKGDVPKPFGQDCSLVALAP